MPKFGTVNISLTNSKLGSQIPSINLPPIITCRQDAPCAHLCYARKGKFVYPNVRKSHLQNLESYQKDPDQYFESIRGFVSQQLVTYKFVRFHSAGDIPNYEYLKRLVGLAEKCPDVKFLTFTKKYELVNRLLAERGENVIPKNLKIVFSAWNKDFKIENPYNFPVTYVNFCNKSQNPEIPELAIPCTGSCPNCLACWSLEKGQSVVFNQH